MGVNLGTIRIGDLGTLLQVVVQNTNTSNVNVTQDLTLATNIKITILDPQGNIVVNGGVATVVNAPGVDGLVQYITSVITSIWTKTGTWSWYITYTIPSGTYSTNMASRLIQ